MTVAVHLGIDVGGTASRWLACDAQGVEIARGQARGATGHIFNPAERERLAGAVSEIAAALHAAGLASGSITAGLTGYGAAVATEVETLLSEALAVPRQAIIVVDDIVLASLANFGPGEGHLISAGTGSIGVHLGEHDQVRVGGRGILIEDAGSGSWIALRALDQLYRTVDHMGSAGEHQRLATSLFAAIGGEQWSDVRQFVYGGDRGRIGTLAVAVAQAAEQGDALALSILRQAGTELARLALALVARVGDRPIGFVGGVFRLHPVILQEALTCLAGHSVSLLEADTVLAAARLQAVGDYRWRETLSRRALIS